MKRLYIFDMDGTLLPKTTANIEIAKVTNTRPDLEDLEKRFARGSINTKAFAAELYGLWGIPDKEIIRKALMPEDKYVIAQKICELNGMNIDDSWAFGDSLSDLPLFERLKSTVAINASAELKEISRYDYNGNDLREAFLSLGL